MSKQQQCGVGIVMALMATAVLADKSPYTMEDDAWISIGGEVQSVTRDAFTLDYGDGMVMVEMDDGDRDADAYKLLSGDRVTVNGMIDDDIGEPLSIEAGSVYVEKLDTYFYASAVDEEDRLVWYSSPVVVDNYVMQGTVTEVNDDSFEIGNGARPLTVDVSNMLYDPLDDEGYQKIEVGDYVRVTGDLADDTLFLGDELEAVRVVTLFDS